MRHPLITAAAIAGVMLVIGARATAGACPAEREAGCETNGITDVSSARKLTQARPRRLHNHGARHHRIGALSHRHGRLKLNLHRDDARSIPARPSPAVPSSSEQLASGAPRLPAIVASAEGGVALSIARRLAETFNVVGYDMRHPQREDPLTARDQEMSAPAASLQSRADDTGPFAAAAPSAAPGGKRAEPIDGIQALPLIAFGSLGATFLMYIAVDSARRRRARRRTSRLRCPWPSAPHEVEQDAAPASLN